jgi:hypothetical protein
MPYSTRVKNGKKILVPDLELNGRNGSTYRENLFCVAKHEGLVDHLLCMARAPFMEDPGREEWYAREIRAKQLLAITIQDDILESLGPKTLFENGAHYFFSQLAYFVYSLTTTVDDHTRTQRAANDEARTSDGVRNRSGRKRKGSPNKKTERRMGEKGETPRGRNDEAAAATGPGKTTTDHHWTDGVSLANPASGPQLVKPTPPPSSPSVESTTPPKRTPPHANESHGMGQAVAGRDDDDSDGNHCRAHQHVNNPAHGADTSTDESDETAASATANTSTDAAALHHDQAKATTDQGHQSTTSASAPPSVSRDLPDEDAKTTDLPRPSRDPADATGDDERRPDAPTEPPDKPEGRKGRRGETRVKTGVSEGTGDEGDDGVETRRPEMPGEPRVESEGLPEVEVEPGGETGVGGVGSAAREDADATADGSAEDAHWDVGVEVESVETCRDASFEVERWSASAHVRLTTRVKESGQRTSRDDENVPGALPDFHHHPPTHTTSPRDRRMNPRASSSRGRVEHVRAAKSDVPATMRTRREYPGVSRMTRSGRRGCRTSQNAPENAQSEVVERTHLGRLKSTPTIRETKRTRR